MTEHVDLLTLPEIRTRLGRKSPYMVRWYLNGQERSMGFRDKKIALRYRSDLDVAHRKGLPFDPSTGKPYSWAKPAKAPTVADWCLTFLSENSKSYVSKSRVNWCDDLIPLILRSAPSEAPCLSEEQVVNIKDWLAGGAPLQPPVRKWLDRWSPRLNTLDKAALSRIIERVKLCQDLQTLLAQSSASNRISHVKQVLSAAVDAGVVGPLDWPNKKKGAKKKSEWQPRTASGDVISALELRRVIDACRNKHPRSFRLQVMSAIMGFGGLRPAEVLALEIQDLTLPKTGWGCIKVRRAQMARPSRWTRSGDKVVDKPKSPNSVREVPIPPVLVRFLISWVDEMSITHGPLFANAKGVQSGWSESLRRACEKTGVEAQSRYALRRAYASHLSAAGMSDADIAKRMGHTIAVLRRCYLHSVAGSQEVSEARLDAFYGAEAS
jgi:integrase